MLFNLIHLLKQLIKCKSISPNDANCQKIIHHRLKKIGFHIETNICHGVTNSYCWKGSGKTLAFACHTDVVPPGDIKQWNTDPFNPTIINNLLYGRGVVDMKGAIAAMIIAVESFVKEYPNHKGKIVFIITSDEEKIAKHGTIEIVKKLIKRKEKIEYCLIGEPSSSNIIGDVIKNGRRGSLSAKLVIKGTQGHVAYPNDRNPIHKIIFILQKLIDLKIDKGNKFLPPTNMQITHIKSGYINCNNITPEKAFAQFNFRFSTETTEKSIRKVVKNLLETQKLDYEIYWDLSGNPYLSASKELIYAVTKSIEYYQNIKPKIENNGGTSDGRFISLMNTQIVELGLINKTIHQVNEFTDINDLEILSKIYKKIIENIMLY